MVGFTSLKQHVPTGVRARAVGDFLAVVGNRRSRRLVNTFVSVAQQAVPELPVEALTVWLDGRLRPIVRLSDHAPFWDLGFPAVMITDTAFLRNPHYHQPTDTLETLDLGFTARVATAVSAAARALAGPPR
jgi:hypothetical protein